MKQLLRACLLSASLLGLGAPRVAHAQDEISNGTYGFADQVPELPGGGGPQALAAAIRARFRFPADAPRAQQTGSFTILAVVTVSGRVAGANVYYAEKDRIKPSVQAAAVAAVRQLPLLTPALLNGRPVQYQFTTKLSLTGQPDSPRVEVEAPITGVPDLSGLAGNGNQPAGEPIANKVYTYAEQMPALPGGSGIAAIQEAIAQRLVVPRHAVEGLVFVRFVVNEEGAVTSPSIIRGVSPQTDAAVLAAVGQLPRFVPGRQNSRPVPVEFTLPVRVSQPTPPVARPAKK